MTDRLKEFRSDLKLTASWIMAALISLGVNAIFIALYAVPSAPNYPILAFGSTTFLVFIVLALSYLPSEINVRLIWSPSTSGYLFQGRYSQQIVSSIQLPDSSLLGLRLSADLLEGDLDSCSHLICLANLRDVLKRNQRKYVAITSATTFTGGTPQPIVPLVINVKGKFSLAISKNQREKLEAEAYGLISDLSTARMQAGVYAFDYDPASWQRFGATFLSDFFNWNISQIEGHILNQILGRIP